MSPCFLGVLQVRLLLIANDIEVFERSYLRASPSFEPQLTELRRGWTEGQPSFFNVLGSLAHHLADTFDGQDAKEMNRVLGVAEDALSEGQEEAKGIDPNALAQELGPNTKRWWNDLSKNWLGGLDW